MPEEIPAKVQALLGYIYASAGPHGIIMDEKHGTTLRKAVKLGLVYGRRMKNGHRKAWALTEAGRLAVENGPRGPQPQ